MTDRDAFGRPIVGPGQTSQPLGKRNPSPRPGPPPRRDGRGLRKFLWWFVLVDAIAIVVVAAVIFAGGSDDELVIVAPKPSAAEAADPGPSSGAGPGAAAEDQPSRPAVAPAGFNDTSLLRPTNFKRALAEAQALGRGKPLMVRAEPLRIDLQLARPDGTLVIMQVPALGQASIVTKVAGAAKGRRAMSWSAISPGAPQRLAQSTRSTPTSGPRSTAYVVFLAQTRQWVLYRESGTGFIGDAAGRDGTQIPGT